MQKEAIATHEMVVNSGEQAVRVKLEHVKAERALVAAKLDAECRAILLAGSEKALGSNAEARKRALQEFLLHDKEYQTAQDTRDQAWLDAGIAKVWADGDVALASLYRVLVTASSRVAVAEQESADRERSAKGLGKIVRRFILAEDWDEVLAIRKSPVLDLLE